MPLHKEIIIALLLKLLGLGLLWVFFFSHPLTRELSRETVQQHWLSQKT